MRRLTPDTKAIKLALVAAACTLLLASAPRAAAQDLDDVSIAGRVTDETGALIVGAQVTVVLTTTNAARTVTTDEEGRYRFVELAPGTYAIKVASPGFAV